MTVATPARTATADHRVAVGLRQSCPHTARSTADGPTYRPVLQAVMLRASTHNRAVVPGRWPALDVDTEQWRSWLAQVAAQREAMEAIAHASPALAARVTRICRGEAVSPLGAQPVGPGLPKLRRSARCCVRAAHSVAPQHQGIGIPTRMSLYCKPVASGNAPPCTWPGLRENWAYTSRLRRRSSALWTAAVRAFMWTTERFLVPSPEAASTAASSCSC